MYILTVEDNFASAHQLRGYKGKCENIHGHNWKVQLNVQGEKLNNIGLLIDYNELKTILKSVVNIFDHKNINDVEPFDSINPSSENIAKFISEKLAEQLNKKANGIVIHSIVIWESETSYCTYIP